MTLMSSTVTDYLQTGNAPQRRGNLANSRSPGAGSFACSDGVISLGVNEESHFRNLANALGRPDWLSDPRFAERPRARSMPRRWWRRSSRAFDRRTASEWEPVLQQAGVPSARIRTLPDCLASPQVQARHYIHTDPETGLRTPTLPFRLNGAPAHSARPARRRIMARTRRRHPWLACGRTRTEHDAAAVRRAGPGTAPPGSSPCRTAPVIAISTSSTARRRRSPSGATQPSSAPRCPSPSSPDAGDQPLGHRPALASMERTTEPHWRHAPADPAMKAIVVIDQDDAPADTLAAHRSRGARWMPDQHAVHQQCPHRQP